MEVNPSPALTERWSGWPGDNVFRVIVPVAKVGSIIGEGGEIMKKLWDDTGARVRVLKGPLGALDRVVLISAKEEPEAEVSPAMEAALRVFKQINGKSSDGKITSESGICSVRLLMASAQVAHLIGKQGSLVKSLEEESGAHIRVQTGDERAYYVNPDENIVNIQGELMKVLKALEAVLGHLRKFLVDHSVIPVYEKNFNKPATEDHVPAAWSDHGQSPIRSPHQTGIGNDYSHSLNRDPLFLEGGPQRDSQVLHSRLFPYGQDSGLLQGLKGSRFVTQVTQEMQMPIRYAEDIIGFRAYVRNRSGAAITILENGRLGEIVVEIKGNPEQVQTAQELIETIVGRDEPVPSSYTSLDTRARPDFSQLTKTTYPHPSPPPPLQISGDYGSYDARYTSTSFRLTDTYNPSSSSQEAEAYSRYGSSRFGDYRRY